VNGRLDLVSQNQALLERLEEAEAVGAAVRSGTVDALIAGPPGNPQAFPLGSAETPYRRYVESMHEGLATADEGGVILYGNKALARILGRPLGSLIGSRARELAVPEDRDALETLLQSNDGAQRSVDLLAADGSSIPALVNVARLAGDRDKIVLVVSDLREHERGAAAQALLVQSERSRRALLSLLEDQTRADQALRKTNRALKTLSAGNEALVRATEERALLQKMSEVLTEVGGYSTGLVGYALDDPEKTVFLAASSGVGEALVREAKFSWRDDESGRSALGSAIRLGSTQVINGAKDDPRLAPWRKLLNVSGAVSLMGIPLRFASGERPFGSMGIATTAVGGFDANECKLLEELAGDLAYGIANLRAGVERQAAATKLRASLEGTISAVAATMESRDPYTAGHQRRVADIASAIATEMGLPAHSVEGIRFGGLIHDLGKIQIPAEILSKPSRLSRLELELIKTHPQSGHDILKGIEFPWPIALMVLQHHERLDGTGYPQGLKGDAIVLEARILAVADVVEAMSSHRPYRPGLGLDAALKEIEEKKGKWFDPAAVDACLRLFREKDYVLQG
jgi:PAS domain S-box-containing protein